MDRAVLFVFSTGGFFKNTAEYLKKHGIAWTSDTRWLEKGKGIVNPGRKIQAEKV